MNTLDVSRWLWDFYLLSTLLLLAVVVVGTVVEQPARRNALAWATAVSLLALACLTTLPNWSRLHLSSPAPPAPAWVEELQPVFGQAIQQTPVIPAVPAPDLPPGTLTAATHILVIDWGVISLYALATGSSVVLCWLALGAWQVRRLRAKAEPAPSEILQVFKQLAQKSAKEIELGMRRDLPVAVAVGLSRPCILLPQTLVAEANQQQLRSVLAHELAHVEHRDLWLLALLRGVMVLLWPHPLFWFLRRRVRLDQELLADAAASELTSRSEYAEQLVALARTAVETRLPRLASSVGLWEKPSQLKQRITLLLDEKLTILRSCSQRWRVGTFVALVGVALGLSLVTLTPAETPKESSDIAKPAADELSGQVVDEAGNPLAGVLVDAWTWYARNEAITDSEGRFSLQGFEDQDLGGIEVQFSKAGFCPAYFVSQPAGTTNWSIQLNSRTYLEGHVTGPDGEPMAQAKVRASRGPFKNPTVLISEVWTETETDAAGKYRLYLEPDNYNVQIHVPGIGLARHEHTVLQARDQRKFDIQLRQGPVFRAKIVDSESGDPVEGIRLWHWMQEGIEGVSDQEGMLLIDNMLPGQFEFLVSTSSAAPYDGLAGEYARWWSPEAADEFGRKDEATGSEFQRNIDELKFDIAENMKPVTIYVEKSASIQGKVIDPEGKPVAGATVAPTRTGTGNSLTGDTRYGVRTDTQGAFLMRLPASGTAKYHLIVHDGDYQEWRTWANGIGEPLQTKLGEIIENVLLQLSEPCIVRGNVVDQNGDPVVGGEVKAESVDKLDNRYYLPTTKTNDQGEFELRHVRPGKHFVRGEPAWMAAEVWESIEADPERPVEGVKLTTEPTISSRNNAFHVEITPPSKEKVDKGAYEKGIFVPTEESAIRKK